MLKRINDVLAGLPMTIIGGVLLVFSFVLPRVDVSLAVDPFRAGRLDPRFFHISVAF